MVCMYVQPPHEKRLKTLVYNGSDELEPSSLENIIFSVVGNFIFKLKTP